MKNTKTPLIEYTEFFNKQRKEAPLEIKIAFREALELFLENPNDPYLRDHALKEKLAGYRSFDITDDWRAVYNIKLIGDQEVIMFHMLGTHEQLYNK